MEEAVKEGMDMRTVSNEDGSEARTISLDSRKHQASGIAGIKEDLTEHPWRKSKLERHEHSIADVGGQPNLKSTRHDSNADPSLPSYSPMFTPLRCGTSTPSMKTTKRTASLFRKPGRRKRTSDEVDICGLLEMVADSQPQDPNSQKDNQVQLEMVADSQPQMQDPNSQKIKQVAPPTTKPSARAEPGYSTAGSYAGAIKKKL